MMNKENAFSMIADYDGDMSELLKMGVEGMARYLPSTVMATCGTTGVLQVPPFVKPMP